MRTIVALTCQALLLPCVLHAAVRSIHTAFGSSPQIEAVVSWRGGDNAQLRYGTTVAYGSSATGQMNADSVCHVPLVGLAPGTRYYYECSGEAAATGSFTTAAAGSPTFRFAVMGDVQGSNVITQRWTDQSGWYAGRQEAFWVPVGDLVNVGELQIQWDAFWGGCPLLSRSCPVMVVRGNHEKYVAEDLTGDVCPGRFTEQFSIPDDGEGMYYSFTFGDALFVVLDQYCYSYQAGAQQTLWMEQVLANSTRTWTFVFLHPPVYSTGGHGGDMLFPAWEALWDQYQVNAVFSGHTHTMSANLPVAGGQVVPSYAEGVLYFNTAGTNYNGAVDDANPDHKPFQSYLQPGDYLPMATEVEVRGDSAIVTTYSYQDGSVYHRVALPRRRNTVPNPGVLTLAQPAYSAQENAATVDIVARRKRGSLGQVTVDFALLPGTAQPGQDYRDTSGTLTFVDGEQEKTLTVRIVDDGVQEPDEILRLVIRNPGGGAIVEAPDTATITIANDDGVISRTLDVQLLSGDDEAEETMSSGSVQVGTLTTIELGNKNGTENQTVGFRFRGVTIPADAVIDSAWVQFTSGSALSGDVALTIGAEASDDAPLFVNTSRNISSRAPTSASAAWTPLSWGDRPSATSAERTPDLSALLQEIIARPGWASGNAVAIIISAAPGVAQRNVYPTNRCIQDYGDNRYAPVLHVTYRSGGVTSASPDRAPALRCASADSRDGAHTAVEIVSLQGRTVATHAASAPATALGSRALPAGVYLVRTGDMRSPLVRRLVAVGP